MADACKVNEDSKCPTCTETPAQHECVQCTVCKSVFHAICTQIQGDNKLCTQSMVKAFLAPSTKDNFRFFCDKCLTKFERSLVETQEERIENLQNKFLGMEEKLDGIMNLLKNGSPSLQETSNKQQNIWHDRERLENVKAPQPKAVLVVKKADDDDQSQENQKLVESAIRENDVNVVKSYKNRAGDLTVELETEEIRDQLKDIVEHRSDEIIINTPREIRHSATIVGIQQEYSKEEVLDMLVKQNGFIRKFTANNVIEQHIRVHVVKPLKNDESKYQVFCDLSSVLREVLHHHKNKLTLGLISCKVYDRYNIKRCYNCQKFGHYAKDCPTNEKPVCGKCSEEHNTRDCDALISKCINCVRNNCDDQAHTVFNIQCPSLIKEQEQLKKKLENARLNVTCLEVQLQR